VIYNAGAYNRCTADVLISARTVDGAGVIQDVAAADLKLAYRSSVFNRGQLPGRVVLSADLSLAKGDPKALADQIAKFDAHRLMAQPRGQNCGSIFRNPEGHSAWSLVDRVGLRGHRIGNAQISQIHTNFILNLGKAKAADVVALIRLAQERAWNEFNVKLETEVAFVGEGFSER
jgi:UDP-N-acetylmuramate dehydrogenase